MLNYKKPRFWVVIASAIVLIGVSITLLSNPVRGEHGELIYYGDVDGNGHEEAIFIDKSQIDNFTLDGGDEKVYSSNNLEFDINGITKLNPSKMIAFADEVNDLLRNSVLLLSTEGGGF